MSQSLCSKKIKKGFTENYKNQMTFKVPVQQSVLRDLESKSALNSIMFNKFQITLSGNNYQKWRFPGKVSVDNQTQKLSQHLIHVKKKKQNRNKKIKQDQDKMKQKQQVLFLELIKQVKWESLKINAACPTHLNANKNLLKQISYIDFPKLLKLELMGNNINSIQPLQTLHLQNLQQLHLSLNKITNIKSLRKLNCSNLKHLDLRANFLNIDKTFECLTKFNGQKLSRVSLQCQNESSIFQQFEAYQLNGRRQNYNRYRRRQNNIEEQGSQIRSIIARHFSNNKSVIRLSNLQSNIKYIYKHCKKIEIDQHDYYRRRYVRHARQPQKLSQPIEIIDYLIQQTVDPLSMLYRFLLKTSSNSAYLLDPSMTNRRISCQFPYQYFIYYGTDIEKLMQTLEEQIEQEDYWRNQFWNDYQSDYGSYFQDYILVCENLDFDNKVIVKRGYFYK